MTTKIQLEDDNIQLIEISSNRSSIEYITKAQSPTISKFRKKNKIDSPLTQSPHQSASPRSKISDLFVVKQNLQLKESKKLQPIPAPRKLERLKNVEESIEDIKKSSETIDTVSGDVQSVFSSETQSYKDRLKNRFLSVKKQAELSVVYKEKHKNKLRKKRSELSEEIIQEDSVLNYEISKHEKIRRKWYIKQQNGEDFFCKIYDKEDTSENKSIQSERKTVVDILRRNDNYEIELTSFELPKFIDLTLNEKYLFATYRYKYNNERNLYNQNYLEDDGIYKPDNPHLTKIELHFLEHHLRLNDNKDWFDSNGFLKILPDPRLNNSYKPYPTELEHSDFVNKYIPPKKYETIDKYNNIFENTLEFTIDDITFRHHHLFSVEHVIAQKLISLFEEYKKINEANLYLIYSNKIEALRYAKNRLEIKLKSGGDSNIIENERYEQYFNEIKSIREKMYLEAKKERTLKLLILSIWKILKHTRAQQKYSNTNVKLLILKTNTDYDTEKQIWHNNIKEEVMEIYQENEQLFLNEMKEYKIKNKQWKDNYKRIKEKEDGDSHSITTSSEILEEKPTKPEKNYSEEEIEIEVIKKCNHCLKPPGEPIIEFEINYNNEITENVDNSKEKLRRNTLNKTFIFIKILYNKREICKSKMVQLNDKFICNFNECFSIKLFKIPQILTLQIYEQTSQINKKLLSEVFINIPDFNCPDSNFELIKDKFISKYIVNYNNNTAVGTGIELIDILNIENFDIFSANDDIKLLSNGIISYKVEWDSVNRINYNDKLEENTFPTIFDIENLNEWIKTYPDPQDPKNALFFDFIQNLELKSDEDKNYFRFDPDMEPFEFCSQDEIDNNLRFKVLKLRNQNEPEFKNIQVPIRAKEISPDILKNYEKRKCEEKVVTDIFTEDFQNENIDVQRRKVNKYLEQAENKIIQLSKIAESKISLQDVLDEDVVPTFSSIAFSFLNWLQPKRPPHFLRKEVTIKSATKTFKEMFIIINIVGALHVPARRDRNEISSKFNQFSTTNVRPFIAVSFQDNFEQTTIAEGYNPIWNQELKLPIKDKSEFLTLNSLRNIRDTIKINLYDETVDDLIVDDRLRNRNIHQQLGCNWLGSLEIPFSSLLYNNQIEGTFKLKTPPILLGYERQSSFQTGTDNFVQNIETFITIYMSLNPSIITLQPILKCDLDSIESPYIGEYIINWQNQYNSLQPQRKFSVFVTTLNGEKCCVTRLINPIKLPPLNNNSSEVTEEQIVKYVAMIPFRENSASGLIADIWLNPDELLKLMMGSVKDHAVLLTSYFLTMGKKAWLLLGYGLPYGYSAFVLTKEKILSDKQYYIYDVITGQKHNVLDSICPLQKVFCVINDENLWGNIQFEDNLILTRFDIKKTSDWMPLFDRNISAPISAFHQTELTYLNPTNISQLQERIERKLKKKIMDLRKHSLTSWNYHCNVSLKKILIKLEENQIRENEFIKHPENLKELQDLVNSYKIRGFAQHFRYTTMKELIDFLKLTGIHLNDNPDIEFSLACHVQSYCNNAVIVWLFIATLIRNK